MNSKNIFFSLVMLCCVFFVFSLPAFADDDNNSIDKAFAKNFENDSNTVHEGIFVSSEYCKAWEVEFNNAIEWRKKKVTLKEDRELIEKFKKSVFEQAELACNINLQCWADEELKPSERAAKVGTAGISGISMTKASFYKKAVLFLIQEYLQREGAYKYKYSGNGVDAR